MGDVLGIVVVSCVSFLLFVGLTFPQYSIEMLGAGVKYWDDSFWSLLWLMEESSGSIGIGLVALYSFVTGVLAMVVIGSIRHQSKGESGFLSVIPAIVFSGCASCGAGLLGVIGAFGYASLFPFEGNLVRAIGILSVILVLAWIGDPRKCEWEPTA